MSRLDDDPGVTAADLRLIEAARSGEGMVELTRELAEQLGAAAVETRLSFEEEFAGMTQEQAALVRRLRCDQEYTWRAVASTCALEWGGDWGSNQLAGMALCDRAAKLHGERYMDEPWN